jgi:hypothetical protein
MSQLKLTFLDRDSGVHNLYYSITSSDLAQRWAAITVQNQLTNNRISARFTNTSYADIGRVRANLNATVEAINAIYDKTLPTYPDIQELSTLELNYLHEQFEVYGDRHHSGEIAHLWSKDLHENFLELNNLIHLHEDVLVSKTATFSGMAMLYDYHPAGLHEPILDRDKIYLEADLKWGGLYLGYNTLGKDWMKVQFDNDIEVVQRQQVRPQRRFAAETWANFGPDVATGWSAQNFERWYLGMSPEDQAKVPIDDLNELTLGRFRIGTLIVDRQFVAKYGGTIEDYRVFNGAAKSEWNKRVFSTFTELTAVTIIQ